MDILQVIRDKVRGLPQDDHLLGLEAVIVHIETAERYLLRAKEENDENFFTDVIYRTNHAFEGILKEAYSILAGKDAPRRTPYEIEQYLLENDIFKPRVMDLFTNYRTEWRNPSTHDYKLFFSEQEAFLAIINVSAFANILLDQIIEQVSFKAEKAKTQGRVGVIKGSIPGYDKLPFLDRVKELLLAFANEAAQQAPLSEYEIIGLLTGFIASIDPKTAIRQEEEINLGSATLRADIILSSEDEKVIVELKVAPPTRNNLSRAEQQLITYLFGSGITDGILFFFPTEAGSSMTVEDKVVNFGGKSFRMASVLPLRRKAT